MLLNSATLGVYFDNGLRTWIIKTAKANHWKVANWMDVSDLIQDGVLCYLKCRNKYALQPPEPGFQNLFTMTPNNEQRKHFMSLVQRSFLNHILTMAQDYPQAKEVTFGSASEESSESSAPTLEDVMPPQPEEVSLMLALKQAPVELSSAIGALMNDVGDADKFVRSKLRKRWVGTMTEGGAYLSEGYRVVRGRRRLRETSRDRLERLTGDGMIDQRLVAYFVS